MELERLPCLEAMLDRLILSVEKLVAHQQQAN